ncbi:M56 family metallopeptidase [Granulicella arctica]|uniref:Beta-lactamase regulating signal transducer with metallopeptidase domain n=1 Tax=Granulicella arctica TaxID=940613 RepID=A0A7Y9TG22_9BACT|nr:M56 family metallopeptidase [Granulicella arctica]NYF78984.1 beta-lactamase regulating signal transducer with metallopeptidase domain [Granulicella arctica]
MHGIYSLAQFGGVSLVSGIWQGFVIAFAVWFCLRLVPKTAPALRFAIWSFVFVVIAVLPLLESLLLRQAVHPVGASLVRLDVRWSVALGVVWLALSLFRAAELVVQVFRVRSLAKRSVPVDAGVVCAGLLSSGRRRVLLCTSTELDRPSVIGFFSPRILVPAWLFAELGEPELEQIVLHEVEHLRRSDDWLNLLQKLSLVLFPLNPILMWVERRLCFERELACDDGVLRRTKAPRTYATCLTELAERGLDRRAMSLALGALERQSQLGRRVHRILRREATLTAMQARGLMGAVVLGMLGGAVGLARCPQVVSFAGARPVQAEAHVDEAAPMPGIRSVRAERVVYEDAPHMTLLKASMDSRQPASGQIQTVTKHAVTKPAKAKKVQRPIVQRAQAEANRPQIQRWVVLTSWSVDARPSMTLPVVEERTIFLPYAAVPTADGWLVVQL